MKGKFIYLFLGSIMLLPLSVVVASTDIFYVQHTLIVGLYFYLFIKRKVRIEWINDIDKIYIIYSYWVIFSFLFNTPISLFSGDADSEIRRIASLFMSLSLLCGYLVGRNLFYDLNRNFKYIIAGMIGTYFFMASYYFLLFYGVGFLDLFAARDFVGQRIPFIICFMAIVSLVLAVVGRKFRFFLFSISVLGAIVVLLSLTRAAYIQLILCILVIFYLAIKKYPGYTALYALLIIGLANIVNFAFFDGEGQIIGRFEQLVDVESQVEDDVSGSFRMNMWKALTSSLSEAPIRWLTGYGQLGASYVARDIQFNMGTIEASSAHSQYFDVLIREGIIGLTLFILLFYKIISLGFFKLNLFQEQVQPIVLAHSVALLGVFFYGFFHETIRFPMFGFYFWMYAGMMSNILRLNNKKGCSSI